MNKNFVILDNGIFGIFQQGTNIFTEKGDVISVKKPKIEYKNIDCENVPESKQKLLLNILSIKLKRIEKENEQEEIKKSIEEMEKKIKDLEYERNELQKEIKKLVKEHAIDEMKKSVVGDETERMSFYDGTLDRIRAKAIVLKSDRPISFTYGIMYRNPTTCHVPKTTEEALGIIDEECYLDITFSKNEIHLNAFSENDMW